MGWTIDEENSKKITYSTDTNNIIVQFCRGGLSIEVKEIQEDKSELTMFKKFIGGNKLGLFFPK